MIPLLLISLSAASPQPSWAEFSRAGALSHVAESVSISTLFVPQGQPFKYRLVYTKKTSRSSETHSVTSLECPAIRDVLIGMRDLTMPRPAPYGIPGENGDIVLDGVGYMLHAPSNFSSGDLVITSNTGSPLATWMDGAFQTLAHCWMKSS